MDEERPQAEAFAVRDGVFTFVGTKEEARKLAGLIKAAQESVIFTDL